MQLLLLMCDLSWWQILLSWLLPFILGWLLSNFLNQTNTQENSNLNEYTKDNLRDDFLDSKKLKELHILQRRNIELESNLEDCIKTKLTLERRIAYLERIEKNEKLQNKNSISINSENTPTEFESNKVEEIVNENKVTERKADIIEPSKEYPIEDEEIVMDELSNENDYNSYNKLNPEKLQIIEGLGPKMETFLNSQNIFNWNDLAAQDSNYIKSKLEELDPKYRILEPGSWPRQAQLARDRKWNELIVYQKKLTAGKSKENTVAKDSKLEKIMFKLGLLRKYKKDDLKAIEGIGPKIEGILHNAGIWTWGQLSTFDVSDLKSILEKAGDRYQLA
ncbi:MAG: hypothetical protein ABIO44_03220, partial [Saprospiraceae bacterium]